MGIIWRLQEALGGEQFLTQARPARCWELGRCSLIVGATCRKKLCGELQKTFTYPGHPGEMFSGVFRALADKLTQPEAERGGGAAAAAKFFRGGHRHILPSFFELLMHLQVISQLLFRTCTVVDGQSR